MNSMLFCVLTFTTSLGYAIGESLRAAAVGLAIGSAFSIQALIRK